MGKQYIWRPASWLLWRQDLGNCSLMIVKPKCDGTHWIPVVRDQCASPIIKLTVDHITLKDRKSKQNLMSLTGTALQCWPNNTVSLEVRTASTLQSSLIYWNKFSRWNEQHNLKWDEKHSVTPLTIFWVLASLHTQNY